MDSLEAEAAAAAAVSHHISPDRCEQRTQRNVTAAFLSLSDTPLAFRSEPAFAHYANRIDSISNAFIRLIIPKVKFVHCQRSARILNQVSGSVRVD